MLLFDADEAGQRAAAKTLPLLLNAELDGRVMILPKGHDPDTFVRELGVEALYEAAGQAVDIVEFVAGRLKDAYPDSLSGQARMLRESREILAQIPDGGKRWLLARRLAKRLDLDEAALGESKGRPRRELAAAPRRAAPAKSSPAAFDHNAGELLKLLLVHPETAPLVFAEMAAWWPDDASRPLFLRLKERFEKNGTVKPEDANCDESEDLAALVSEAAMSSRLYSPDTSGQIVSEQMSRLKGKWRQKRQEEMSREIKKAEAEGRDEDLQRLLIEKNALHKSSKLVK